MPMPNCHSDAALAPPESRFWPARGAVVLDGLAGCPPRRGRSASSPGRSRRPSRRADTGRRRSGGTSAGSSARRSVSPSVGVRSATFVKSQSGMRLPFGSSQARDSVFCVRRPGLASVKTSWKPAAAEVLAHVPLERRLAVAEHVPRRAHARRDVVEADAVAAPACSSRPGTKRSGRRRSRRSCSRVVVAQRAAQRQPAASSTGPGRRTSCVQTRSS